MNFARWTLHCGMILALVVFCGTAGASGAGNGDAEAGKAKSQPCQACHGPDGNGNPALPDAANYPRLAGQYADYLSKALHDYKSGARQNPIMAGFAGTLKDQDIADLAAYFSAQTGPIHDLSESK